MTSSVSGWCPKFTSVIDFILTKYEVREPGTGAVPTVDSFLKDEELQRILVNIFEEESSTKKSPAKKSSAKKSSAKKSSAKKSSAKKSSATPEERNKEKFDEGRCSARKWEAEGGLGYDNIQCSSCKKIPTDEAEKVMEEFKEKMDGDQLARLPEYLEKYDGCFCKNHLKQDFFMPNGWWLGKVNEDRPEKPMLPKGSFKDGYQEDCKEHHWMYGPDGQKVEKTSKKKVIKKKSKKEETKKVEGDTKKKVIKKKSKKEETKKVEEDTKKKVLKKKVLKKKILKKKPVEEEPKKVEVQEEPKEVEEEKVPEKKEEPKEVEEKKPVEKEVEEEPKKVEEKKPVEKEVEEEPKKEEPKKVEEEKVDAPIDSGSETDPMSSEEEELEEDEDDYETKPYEFEGKEYMKIWDDDEKIWIIVDPESQEMIGHPNDEGGIDRVE